VLIRNARDGEHLALSELAMRSKAIRGYPADVLEAMRGELTLTAADGESDTLWLAETDGRILGFAVLSLDPPSAELEFLFVDPPAIGTGVGSALLRHALEAARSERVEVVVLDADPGAEAFYLRHGAVRVGDAPSGSIPGRFLPRLEFRLAEGSRPTATRGAAATMAP
jgi:GNAT superfamily N-acetyltransferase